MAKIPTSITRISTSGLMAIIVLLFSTGGASATSLNQLVILDVNGTFTEYRQFSVNQYESINSYQYGVQQISDQNRLYNTVIGGTRMMVLLNDGTVVTKDDIQSNWTTQTTGAQAIAIGANGEMMLVNGAGNAYSKMNLYDAWVQQTSGGGIKDIAVSGTGRLMLVDSANNAYSKDSTYDSWTKQVNGANSVTLGPNGQMGVIDSAGNAYSKMNRYDAWVQQTSGGGTQVLEIGGNGRMMVIDSANNAYSKNSTYDTWLKQVNGAYWVAVGTSGRMVVLNSSYEVYYKDAPTLTWNKLTYSSSYPTRYVYAIDIN